MSHQMDCNGRATATPEIEYGCRGRQQTNETIVPPLVAPTRASPIGIPCSSMSLVMSNDFIRETVQTCLQRRSQFSHPTECLLLGVKRTLFMQ
jgi:hypothetical protein